MFEKEEEINNFLISKGMAANWSLCRVTVNCVPKYFFRVVGIDNFPECSGITKEEAVKKYFELFKSKCKKT